jgi:hypothetical protein
MANQNRRKARPDSLRGQLLNFVGDFMLDGGCNGCAVEDFWHHPLQIFMVSDWGIWGADVCSVTPACEPPHIQSLL